MPLNLVDFFGFIFHLTIRTFKRDWPFPVFFSSRKWFDHWPSCSYWKSVGRSTWLHGSVSGTCWFHFLRDCESIHSSTTSVPSCFKRLLPQSSAVVPLWVSWDLLSPPPQLEAWRTWSCHFIALLQRSRIALRTAGRDGENLAVAPLSFLLGALRSRYPDFLSDPPFACSLATYLHIIPSLQEWSSPFPGQQLLLILHILLQDHFSREVSLEPLPGSYTVLYVCFIALHLNMNKLAVISPVSNGS